MLTLPDLLSRTGILSDLLSTCVHAGAGGSEGLPAFYMVGDDGIVMCVSRLNAPES